MLWILFYYLTALQQCAQMRGELSAVARGSEHVSQNLLSRGAVAVTRGTRAYVERQQIPEAKPPYLLFLYRRSFQRKVPTISFNTRLSDSVWLR